jgi:hypothetical protein
MNIIPGYSIQVIPSDLGTLIALDRDRLEADVAAVIQEDETDFVRGFDFQCEVVEDTVVVNRGRVRTPAVATGSTYVTDTITQATLSGFLPEEEGDVYIDLLLNEDPILAPLQFFGTVTFVNEYGYSAGMSNKSRATVFATIAKGVMPPTTMDYTRVRLAEYSVSAEGNISLTQSHFGSITVQRPPQHNDFAINFDIV